MLRSRKTNKDLLLFWIFASVVLVLLVISEGFRRFSIRAGVVLVGLSVLVGVGYGLFAAYDYEFGPRVVIEGISYRVSSSETYYAYQREREHLGQREKEAPSVPPVDPRTQAQRAASSEYSAAVLRVYEKYPFLNSENPMHNQAAIDEAIQISTELISGGAKSENAVMAAADMVAKKYRY